MMMSVGLFRWRFAMMVISGLALIVVHTQQNMLPNLQTGIRKRALSNKTTDTNQNEQAPLSDMQDFIHHQDIDNQHITKNTRDKQETAAAEDGLLVVGDGDNNEPPTLVKKKYRGWVMMHTLKAGGNSVERLLQTVGYNQRNNHSLYQHGRNGGYVYFEDAAVDRLWYDQYMAQWEDGNDAYFSALPRDEFFKIGMVREPCDYMVSIWAFSGGQGPHPHRFLTGRCAGKESKDNFTQFLHETSMPYQFGWLSYRVALQLGAAGKENIGALICPSKATAATISQIEARVANFIATEAADCWVRTENMLDDLHRCLKLYVSNKRGGGTSMTINNFPLEKTPLANKGQHKSCFEYYSEQEASAVWEREGKFAEQFGYSGCCKGLADPHPI